MGAAKIGGMLVRKGILAARKLRNVQSGSTYQDDIERKLLSATEYLKQLSESLRALMPNAFSLDMGFRNDTAGEEDGRPDTFTRARSQMPTARKPTKTVGSS